MAAAAEENAASAVLAKILAMAFLGVSSFVVGSTPVCVFERLGIRRRARGAANAVLRLILNFGGGVLLCTTFLHLLPEVREGVEQLTNSQTLSQHVAVGGMLAELIMCVGFFIMYSVEELVHGFVGEDCHANGDQHQHHHHHHHHGNNNNHHPQNRNDPANGTDGQSNPSFEKSEQAVSAASATAGRVANYNSCTSAVEIAAVEKSEQSSDGTESVLRGFLVVGALSIHELFEGLAVGLEKNPTQVSSQLV